MAEAISVRRVDVFRSSLTEPFRPGMTHTSDMYRKLTAAGIARAEWRQQKLGYPKYDGSLFSPAERCVRTAALLSNIHDTSVNLAIDELGYQGKDSPEGAAIAKLYAQLGDANLRAYDHVSTRRIFERHAIKAWVKIWETIIECDLERTLVVGHNIFISAMGYIASFDADNSSPTDVSAQFEHCVLDKCEGYSLIFEDGLATSVEFHKTEF